MAERPHGWPIALALSLVAACGTRAPEPAGTPAPAPATDGGPATAEPGIPHATVFGFPLGGTRAELAAARPDVALPADDGSGLSVPPTTVMIEGLAAQVGVELVDDRLVSVGIDITGPAATEESYRKLQARAVADLGPGHATRCESDDGIPFDEYMLHGWGGLRSEWRDPPFAVTGELALTKDYGPEGLRLHGMFVVPRLLPADEFPYDDLVRGEKRLASGCRDDLPAAPHLDRGTAAKDADACTVDLSAAPAAALLGLPFGASRADVEQELGRPLEDVGLLGRNLFTQDVEGVPVQVHLAFYDGCLAVVMFVAGPGPATMDNYRTLRAWARTTALGAGDALRCFSEDGTPDEEYVAAGFGFIRTIWRGGEPLEGSLRLERSYETAGELQIVFEADYLPLRGHAPQIDFAEGELAPPPAGVVPNR
jgi:hypothetical protein